MGMMNLTLVNHLNHFVPVFLRYCEGNIEVSTSRLADSLLPASHWSSVTRGKVQGFLMHIPDFFPSRCPTGSFPNHPGILSMMIPVPMLVGKTPELSGSLFTH